MADELPEVEQFEVLGALNQRRMCAPLQRNLDEVHVVEFDIAGVRRAERIAPGLYYGKPITPYPNPANNPQNPTKGHSYFRVLWRSSTDPSTRLEFIIRDYDLYLLGFRQGIGEQDWSKWYCFKDDLGWPVFFPEDGVQQLWFDGGHENNPEIGGADCISNIFYTLAYWNPDDAQQTMLEALQQAVVFLSEALRFHWVAEEIVYRIIHNVTEPLNLTRLGELPMWKRIGSWRNFCRMVLLTGLNNGVIETRRLLAGRSRYDQIYQIHGFMDLVNGLRVLKRVEACRNLEPQGNQRRLEYGLHVLDPGFIALNEDYPEEAAGGHWWFT